MIAASRRELRRQNQKLTPIFVEIPEHQWPQVPLERGIRIRLLRNNRFLVQVFEEPTGFRLSILRTELQFDGDWMDGITWDELFNIKNDCGYGNYDAVEIYPRKEDLVYVANIRHLWVMKEPLPFGWRKANPCS